ncbi:chemotaxis protein CheY [Candidatus Magnetomorum sp. HK-1]|nr:chemotaxis protein CheY [Candidatus Magnetomorum sp. HK-1]
MKLKKHPFNPILLVDNDPENSLWDIEKVLISAGFNHIEACHKTPTVFKRLASNHVNVALIQVRSHDTTNMDLFRSITKDYPQLSVIAIVDRQDILQGERCMKHGAFDYIIKPFEQNRMINVVRHAIEAHELKRINQDLQEKLLNLPTSCHNAFSNIVAKSRKMLALINYIESISQSSRAIFISGETGTGKTTLAYAAHEISRPQNPVYCIDISKMDDYAFSELLFGQHVQAVNGHNGIQKGLVEKAENGSLVIKNIDQLSLISQNKLFRLLKDNEYIPLGANQKYKSNARIIVTSNTDIKILEKKGRFRKDLIYHLMHHHIKVPPLRERLDDISLLITHFIESAARKLNKKPPTPPKELFVLLETYLFPGNVAELKKLVYDAVHQHKTGILSMQLFKERIITSLNRATNKIFPDLKNSSSARISFSKILPTLKQSSWLLIAEAMHRAKGNQSVASHLLGISQQALSKRLQNMEAKKIFVR